MFSHFSESNPRGMAELCVVDEKFTLKCHLVKQKEVIECSSLVSGDSHLSNCVKSFKSSTKNIDCSPNSYGFHPEPLKRLVDDRILWNFFSA